jgi:hypothetical protein
MTLEVLGHLLGRSLATNRVLAQRHEHDVVEDQLDVGEVHRAADLDEEPQPVLDREARLFSQVGDRLPVDRLHHQAGSALLGLAAVEDTGDVGMG